MPTIPTMPTMIRHNSDVELQLPDTGTTESSDIPDDHDIEMLSDDQKNSLPPHIAARFYRKVNGGRRISSTSSRRSSISSLHSNVSPHGRPQSDHVAQHLRRASILESRKARLADRAAHAEKVRLRAALAKAATRNLHREERALAAQQARERLLAEITAKCEEEVKRAKKKAQDNREKKAAEHARLRLEMAEKFAEAEKRRLLYQQNQRRNRTTSLPSGEDKKMVKALIRPLNRDTAARILQRAWRRHSSRTIMNDFGTLNLSLQRIQNMTFDEVGEFLSEEVVLNTMARVLRLCGLQGLENGTMGERGAVRTFLSSYLILTHPSQVFTSNGDQEQDLIAKGRDLLETFEQATSRLLSGYSPFSISPELQALCETYNVFFSAFHAWKTHDSSVLIEIMLAQFTELELIWQTVKDDREGGVADDYQQGIRQNQILLLAKLKRLAGPEKAMQMVKEALRKAKRKKKSSSSSIKAIPRSTSVPPSTNDVHPDSVASPLSETFNHVDSAALQELDKHRISPHERFSNVLTTLPENRVLVHELLINKKYKIEQAPYTEPRRQLMKHMCEMMRRDVQAGLGTNWTVAMATVIQDKLLRSLTQGNSLYVLISEVLDPKLIENQCKAGTFSYDTFFDFMSSLLPKLCAPFRDPEVKAFAEDKSGDAIDRLARLMGIIDLLSLDHTNFMIHLAAPQLIEEARVYEQRAFESGVQDGSIKLDKTRHFWRRNRGILVEEMRRRDPDNFNREPQLSVAKIYAQGLVDLVICNGPVSEDLIPETLCLDRERLERLHARTFKIAATASILLTGKNLLKRDVRSQWKPEADHIVSLDFRDIIPERVLSIIESTHPMPLAAKSQLLATVKRVLPPVAAASAVASPTFVQTSVEVTAGSPSQNVSSANLFGSLPDPPLSSFSDPVARLILSRLRAHVFTRLSASSSGERLRAATTASQSLAAAGMPEFVAEVGKLVEELSKVREVDWTCHGMVYEHVWGEEIPQEQA